MDTTAFATTAITLAGRFGTAAHHAIALYRDGGERIAGTLEARWNAAFKESSPQLTAETRKNAARAQRAFSTAYSRGLAMSADGAVVAVDTVVGATVAAITRANEFATANLRKTA